MDLEKQAKQFYDLKFINKLKIFFYLQKFEKEIIGLDGWGKVSFKFN